MIILFKLHWHSMLKYLVAEMMHKLQLDVIMN